MIQFPEDPHDGMQLIDYVDEVTVIIWTYDLPLNQWTSKKFGTPDTYVFTDQVLVRDNITELPTGAQADPSTLKTQKEVNHWLNDASGGGDYLPLTGGDVTGNIRFDGGGALGAIAGETAFISLHFESGAVRYTGWCTEDDHLVTKKQLDALQEQVDNLSGLLIQARYEQGTGITTRPGQFVCVANDTQQNRFSQGTELRLYETDLDQKNPALTRVIAGDTIHIADPYGASCSLEVTYAAGTVLRYTNAIGTLDRISDRTPYSFRISGQA